jgi:uncharacterized protein DUF6585
MDSSPPAGSPATTREAAVRHLGDPVATFQPGMENLVAGIIIGLLMVAGGGTLAAFAVREAVLNGAHLPWWAETGSCLIAVIGMGAIGLLVAAAGVAVILWVRGLFSLRVLVSQGGFVCVRRKEVQVFPWDQVERVRETVTQEYFPLQGVAKYAAPMDTSRSFVVRRRDGLEFAFDGNAVKKVNTLAKMIEEAARERGIPWDIVHA